MKSTVRVWNVFMAFALMLGVLLATPRQTAVQAAGPAELFFSEYVEGSSNNKALEIYNGTGAAVDLAAGGYNIQMFFNGNPVAGLTINLTGTVADGDVYVLAHSSAVAVILAQADQTNGAGWFNGNDAVALRKGTTIIDVIGQIGYDPGSQWGTDLTSTADNTLRRKPTVLAGDPDGSNAFDPTLEWIGYANNTFDGLGSHTVELPVETAPFVATTSPANGATNVPVSSDITITFSEPVNIIDPWFDLTCSTSGTVLADVSGGPTIFTLDPVADFVNETCTLTVYAAQVSDQDSDDPPDVMAADYTITFSPYNVCFDPYTEPWAIQGSGLTAAITGPVTSQGVVVGDYEGASPTLRGFYLQSLTGDGDPATSDGIFVFNGNNNSVSLGDVVRVTGNAGENFEQTQISASTITACGTGTVDPVDVEFPVTSSTHLEQFEGMLVRLPQTMFVTEHFQLGRFGQVVVSSGSRLSQPTNVVLPGAEALALQEANNLNRIIIDDALNNQNPDPIVFSRDGSPLSASNTLRGGDTISGAVGVMTYTWAGNSASPNAYRLRPVNALGATWDFVPENDRPTEPLAVSGTLKVGALNLLNYFNTFDGLPDRVDNCTLGVGGLPTDCRGADTAAEFERQWVKTVAAILKMNVDVLGIIEIENDGYSADSAIADLVNKLNAETAPGTYAFIDADAATEQINALGVDAIKVGFLYKPAMVTPVGRTAALNSIEFVNGGDSEARNRPALAQAFQQNSNGSRFIAVVNHLKSKGGACDLPDQGDGQGNCNEVRVNASLEMAGWLASDPTLTGDPDIVLLGDMNSYAMEDPIAALEDIGFTNLISLFLGPDAYSYVFDGQWGYLDHALASPSLISQVTGIAEYHINADEPSVLDYNTNFKTAGQILSLFAPDEFRVSDHDPIIIGLDLQAMPYPSDLGFTTGGGWVPAEEATYFYNAGWSGKAQFMFDVMYKKENVTPQGTFYLALEGAGFELTSSNIEWLTISGDGTKAIFTGSGIGTSLEYGEMEYRYMVWLQEGKRDNIRIQVWDSTQLVFDNMSLQRLAGNISIHR
ncbi:MAG: ExeM/NucH family extracellular endonuclease [Bellilinea sp.]